VDGCYFKNLYRHISVKNDSILMKFCAELD